MLTKEEEVFAFYAQRLGYHNDQLEAINKKVTDSLEDMSKALSVFESFSETKNTLIAEIDKIGALAKNISSFHGNNADGEQMVFYSADYKAIIEHIDKVVEKKIDSLMNDDGSVLARTNNRLMASMQNLEANIETLNDSIVGHALKIKEWENNINKSFSSVDASASAIQRLSDILANLSSDIRNNPNFYNAVFERLSKKEDMVSEIHDTYIKLLKVFFDSKNGTLKNFTREEVEEIIVIIGRERSEDVVEVKNDTQKEPIKKKSQSLSKEENHEVQQTISLPTEKDDLLKITKEIGSKSKEIFSESIKKTKEYSETFLNKNKGQPEILAEDKRKQYERDFERLD